MEPMSVKWKNDKVIFKNNMPYRERPVSTQKAKIVRSGVH
jgi:hypothetical protein